MNDGFFIFLRNSAVLLSVVFLMGLCAVLADGVGL